MCILVNTLHSYGYQSQIRASQKQRNVLVSVKINIALYGHIMAEIYSRIPPLFISLLSRFQKSSYEKSFPENEYREP